MRAVTEPPLHFVAPGSQPCKMEFIWAYAVRLCMYIDEYKYAVWEVGEVGG